MRQFFCLFPPFPQTIFHQVRHAIAHYCANCGQYGRSYHIARADINQEYGQDASCCPAGRMSIE